MYTELPAVCTPVLHIPRHQICFGHLLQSRYLSAQMIHTIIYNWACTQDVIKTNTKSYKRVTLWNDKHQDVDSMTCFPTSLAGRSNTYCWVITSNQFLSTSSPRCVSSHSFSLIRAVTCVWNASSDKLAIFSSKFNKNSSILFSTKSVLSVWQRLSQALLEYYTVNLHIHYANWTY